MYAIDVNMNYVLFRKRGADMEIRRFNKGDIVYWCHQDGHRYSVHYGMVNEQFLDAVSVDYLSPRERRLINGVPIDAFESETRYKKLPKGWSYNTKLFEITYQELSYEEEKFRLDLTSPSLIKEAYGKGYLVKDCEIFHGNIEAEITKEGYRIVKRYPMYYYHIDRTTIKPNKLYFAYEEAEKEVNDNIAEFHRQASLSDYDWSLEQIDKTINKWKMYYGASDEKAKQYHDWFVDMKKVEDIETRFFAGEIQWKYWKNKNWNYIEL